ncbi:DNA-(apurinic or apyrimidinic site) endonuclease 2-like isoform X2 [Bradysia coprophila]|nr:DNA-(apurinic or apyrimidinic site) endonuclease 2-like isoform X2 [Bradysia coprophila]
MESAGFNVVSWNVNGLRTINIKDALSQLDCSILGIQETKLARDALSEDVGVVDHYTACFSFCRNRTGYSGVALYCRDNFMPTKSEEGLSGLLNKKYSKGPDSLIASYGNVEENEKTNAAAADDDGRSILTQHTVKLPNGEHKLLTVINVYCPRLRTNDPDDPVDNTDFKYTFHNTLGKRANALVANGSFVIVMGDFNISHRPIDRVEADDTEEFATDVFRKWIDELLSLGFVDTFRMLHPDTSDAFTCWCSRTNARQNNYGSRIDYIMVDKELSTYLEKAEVHSDIYGSDHCPISATFHTLIPVPAEKPPLDAAKYYKEFCGKQTNLKDFLSRNDGCPTQNAFEILNRAKSKRNNGPEGKQADITKFFAKKPKITNDTMTVESNSYRHDDMTSSGKTFVDFQQRKEKSLADANQDASKKWKNLMSTPNTPSCAGHNELCVLRTVRKKGLNQGRKFWACPRGVGQSNDPNANCNHFAWVVNTKS